MSRSFSAAGTGGANGNERETFNCLDADSIRFLLPYTGLPRRDRSFAQLEERAYAELRGRVVRVLHGHDADVIDETTQQMALRLAHLLGKFDPDKGTLNFFLYGSIRRTACECQRFHRGPVSSKWSVERPGEMDEITLEQSGQPSDPVEIEELFQMVLTWVNELPDAQREAVVLWYLCPVKSRETHATARRHDVNRCRGLKHLRARAAAWLRFH